ncbi:transposase [Stutzerimonas stutzeri]|uniref:REP-associated tyrosine transposase n=1 Tax=Stutzerimonas stutzeri TaxID=316 RepID=UPI0037157AC7
MRFHGRDLRKGRVSLSNQTYVLTCVTLKRSPIFIESAAASMLAREIHMIGQSGSVQSLAWVVMPDHLHWLVQLKTGSLSQVMQQLKSRSAIAVNARLGSCGPIWQKGYHDRAIRDEEDLRDFARYIVANPMRAGLVRRIGDYPFWDATWL